MISGCLSRIDYMYILFVPGGGALKFRPKRPCLSVDFARGFEYQTAILTRS